MKKNILFASLSLILFLCCDYQAFARQTQINKVNDLFNIHIENKDALLQDMIKQNENGVEQIKSRNHHDSIEGIDGAEAKANELNSIKETDLETSGRQKRISQEYKFYDENELEPDYTKPGNRMHKLDAADVVDATEKAMRKIGIDLMARLIELGFNCKTVKGAIHKEPTYYIEIKREDQKNTEYDQFFCEEPRNQYNCNDTLTLTCKTKGMKWGEWQDKEIHIRYDELFKSGKMVFWVDHTGKRCFEYKLSVGPRKRKGIFVIPPDPYHVLAMREFLTTKHEGATIDNISDQMSSYWYGDGDLRSIDGWSYGGRVLGSKDYAWLIYVVKYKYREGSPICLEWSEDWDERCMLK